MPTYWELPPPKDKKKKAEFEESHLNANWNVIPKEYLERHDSAIRFVSVSQTDALVWSVDASNLVCCWR